MLEAVRDRARPYFEDAPPAHDWHHVRRVETLSDRLASEYDIDVRTLELAVWLHDIERAKEDAGETQYNHIHAKLLDLPDRMYTDVGRRLAEERRAFVERFLTQFDAEIAGQR